MTLKVLADLFYFHFKNVFLLISSEGRPSRSDLSILVAHNDDPTGNISIHLDNNMIFDCNLV